MEKLAVNNIEETRRIRQVNQYDKIFRENLDATLPGLIRNLLGIQAVHTEELPDAIQHTKERKPDVLKKVTDPNGLTFVLHIEFQVKNEKKMVFRMAEYYIMLVRKYQLPVRQYVLYLGVARPSMKDFYRSPVMYYKYKLIVFAEIDYQLLLGSDKPEEKMLAILANFGDEEPEQVIEKIVSQVIDASKENFSQLKHFSQLRILAQLRKLAPKNLLIMDSIAGLFKEENDIFYQRGELKGRLEGREEGFELGKHQEKKTFVRYLLLNTDFTTAKIASLTGATEDFIQAVKITLS